jgi:hypothetical protein
MVAAGRAATACRIIRHRKRVAGITRFAEAWATWEQISVACRRSACNLLDERARSLARRTVSRGIEPTEPQATSSASARRTDRLLAAAALALTAALAARTLYCSPYDASDLGVTPDEIEYAVCARRMATVGRYDMDFDGVSTPPHSTPWFSAVLAPAYVVAPHEIGNGIWIIFLFAVVGVIVVLRIGTLVAGPLGGALASIALLALPTYARSAQLIMTDCPAVVLGLVAVWLALRWSPQKARLSESVVAGLLVAIATAFRSVYLSLLLPFAWRAVRAEKRRFAHAVALLTPLAVLAAADGLYNHAAFGDWHRTGYQFWLAVPYDYPDLVLSFSYLKANVATLMSQDVLWPVSLGTMGVILLVLRRPPLWRHLLSACALTALPISAVHSLYFFHNIRFHEFVLVLCTVLGGVGLVCALPANWREHKLSLVASVALLAIAFIVIQPPPRRETRRRQIVDAMLSATPDDAVIICWLEPVYCAAFEPPGSHRKFLAASRNVEFASKVLVRTPVSRERAAPRDAFDHAAPGLLENGARWAIANTADEMHEQIEAWVRAGRPVVLEAGCLRSPSATKRILGTSLKLEQGDRHWIRVVLAE